MGATNHTVVELARDGSRTVFHRRGDRAWTHPHGEPAMVDGPLRFDCPECVPVAERLAPETTRTAPCKHGHSPTNWRFRKSGRPGYCLVCVRAARAARKAS